MIPQIHNEIYVKQQTIQEISFLQALFQTLDLPAIYKVHMVNSK